MYRQIPAIDCRWASRCYRR